MDFEAIANQLRGMVELLDFFRQSGMERFDYNLFGKYTLTIYKVKAIIRIDIQPIVKETENTSEGK